MDASQPRTRRRSRSFRLPSPAWAPGSVCVLGTETGLFVTTGCVSGDGSVIHAAPQVRTRGSCVTMRAGGLLPLCDDDVRVELQVRFECVGRLFNQLCQCYNRCRDIVRLLDQSPFQAAKTTSITGSTPAAAHV
jgi:hypothetical protein